MFVRFNIPQEWQNIGGFFDLEMFEWFTVAVHINGLPYLVGARNSCLRISKEPFNLVGADFLEISKEPFNLVAQGLISSEHLFGKILQNFKKTI